MLVGIGEKNYQCWICTVDTWVIDISFILDFMAPQKRKRGESYQIYGNNPLPEKIKYNTKC